MIPKYQAFSPDKVDEILRTQLESRGIAQEELDKPVGEGTLRTLLCELISETLTEAQDDARQELASRQELGRHFARQNGVRMGRPCKTLSDRKFEKVRALYEGKSISAAQAARMLGISVSTFYRRLKDVKKSTDPV